MENLTIPGVKFWRTFKINVVLFQLQWGFLSRMIMVSILLRRWLTLFFVSKDSDYAGANFDKFPGGEGGGCLRWLRLSSRMVPLTSLLFRPWLTLFFVLKYSDHVQTSRSSSPLQWPPVLVENPMEGGGCLRWFTIFQNKKNVSQGRNKRLFNGTILEDSLN